MADAIFETLMESFKQKLHPQFTRIPLSYNSSSSVIVEVLNELNLESQVQRVPPLFKITEAHQNAYDPVIVSIGPYHHGNIKYSHAQAFKETSLDLFISESSSNNDKAYFHGKILERIQDIKKCYEKIEINNVELAWLILCDASFFILHLQCLTKEGDSWLTKFNAYYTYFGAARIEFIARDLLLLENQIPFWIIKHVFLLSAIQTESTWNQLLTRFTNKVLFEEDDYVLYMPINAFHLLGAYYQVLEEQFQVKHGYNVPTIFGKPIEEVTICGIPICGIPIGEADERNPRTSRFRSITDLKANGIRLVVSRRGKAIMFPYNSLSLLLPPLVLPTDFFVLYSNLIAYETSPTGNTNFFVSSFINFMKSLIQNPNDVKILREEGILFNMVSDDDVVKGINDLDTFGLEKFTTFSEIRNSIERHCSTRAISWMAEQTRTTFRNPCTILALLASVLLLCLTFLQTFFTIRPLKL